MSVKAREGVRYAALSSFIHLRWSLDLGWQLHLASPVICPLRIDLDFDFTVPNLLSGFWRFELSSSYLRSKPPEPSLHPLLSASLRLLISYYHILELLMLLAPFTSDTLEICRITLI